MAAGLYSDPIGGLQGQLQPSGEKTSCMDISDGYRLRKGGAKVLYGWLGRLLPPGSHTARKMFFTGH
jgi:hypothetical protein